MCLSEQLFNLYPNMFIDLPYIECDNGWNNIISDFCYNINIIHKQLTEDQSFKIEQLKEKFGVLTIYLSHYPEDKVIYNNIKEIILNSVKQSSITCEICGAPGRLRTGIWIKCKCDNCYDKYPGSRKPLLL